MEKKICKLCKCEFQTSDPLHDYCHSCYTKKINPLPRCKKCGCELPYDYLINGWKKCTKCYFGK